MSAARAAIDRRRGTRDSMTTTDTTTTGSTTTNTPTRPAALRLHHTAYVTKDQAATRAFYEDILGVPLLAPWAEADELFGAERVYCHTFFGLADGSALAFFQFANKAAKDLSDPDPPPCPFPPTPLKARG